MDKKQLKNAFFATDRVLQGFLDKTPFTHAIYEKMILPIEAGLFKAGNYKISHEYRELLAEAKERYFTEEEKRDHRQCRQLENLLVKVFIAHRMKPHEYFLYGLRGKGYWELKDYLTDLDRKVMLDKVNNQQAEEELTDKGILYHTLKKYFGREACIIDKEHHERDFVDFVSRHPTFIIKPIKGSTGKDAEILTVDTAQQAAKLYDELKEKDTWIAEQLIQQHPSMAAWNASSVNTLRVPTFYTKDGCKILQPYFRTGRQGSVIDNAGQGGVFAVFDPDTGIIVTDGVDEFGGRYPCHPDSGLVFKGWQIPHYEELKSLAAQLIHELPSQPRYVGFDFSLTEQGWILVEGNYNGQFVGQIAEHKGVRQQFIRYFFGNSK